MGPDLRRGDRWRGRGKTHVFDSYPWRGRKKDGPRIKSGEDTLRDGEGLIDVGRVTPLPTSPARGEVFIEFF